MTVLRVLAWQKPGRGAFRLFHPLLLGGGRLLTTVPLPSSPADTCFAICFVSVVFPPLVTLPPVIRGLFLWPGLDLVRILIVAF